MLFSIKSFVNKLSPTDMKEGFLSYKTNVYRLNYFETPTKVKFVLNTDFNVTHPIVKDLLVKIYSQVSQKSRISHTVTTVRTPIVVLHT